MCRYRDSGGLDTKRGSEEHEQLLRSCGWAIRAEEMEIFLLAKDITGRQLLSSSWCAALPPRTSVEFPTQRQVRYGLQQRRQLSLGQAATVRLASILLATRALCSLVSEFSLLGHGHLIIPVGASFAATRRFAPARAARRTAAACVSAATGRVTDRKRRALGCARPAPHFAAATACLPRSTTSWG